MAFLLFITAVVLSGIAAYYSVIGLIAIFSAAALPVAIMGGSLEAAKLVVASWLYRYWKHIPWLMRVYFTSALLILMLITSMGIFGFLSKAHSDQSLVGGDVLATLSVYDEKIKTAKENIEANRKVLRQLDEAVDQVMARSTSETGADKAVAIRRGQQKDRARISSEIAADQKLIASVNAEAAPIRAEIRKIEAEVGPLKYIAALIYGDNPDENMLERSVRWLIILLICVFDPLAVLMLIAANLTQIRSKQTKEEVLADVKPFETIPDNTELPVVTETAVQPETPTVNAETVEPSVQPAAPVETVGVDPAPVGWMFPETVIQSTPSKKLKKARSKKIKQETSAETIAEIITVNDSPNAPGLDASIERPGDYLAAPLEQTQQDKSFSETEYFTAPDDDSIDRMIAEGDKDSLEAAYKKIVKELAKKNRSKSTHWGPLKTK